MARRHHDPVVVRGTHPHGATHPTAAGDRPVAAGDRPVAAGDRPVAAGSLAAGSLAAAGDLGGVATTEDASDLVPRDFVWRGRRYTVCAVLASWQERRAWWREVGDDTSGPPSPQRRVWRVEARLPVGDAGVFDLGRDDDHWLLLRTHD